MKRTPRDAKTILLADDEPYNLEWLSDYIARKGLKVVHAPTVREAIARLEVMSYRVVVADLSIPLGGYSDPPTVTASPLMTKYPGLIIANFARHRDHLDRQVIVYSVHDDPAISGFAAQIRCTYLLKGRPRQFKEELDEVLAFDPLGGKGS